MSQVPVPIRLVCKLYRLGRVVEILTIRNNQCPAQVLKAIHWRVTVTLHCQIMAAVGIEPTSPAYQADVCMLLRLGRGTQNLKLNIHKRHYSVGNLFLKKLSPRTSSESYFGS